MPYIGNTPAEKYAAFNVQNFTTSATTSYTLDRAVANELDIRLVINNVIQQPGAGKAYTAAGTTLTLSGATTGTDTMYAVYIGKAVQTVNPGAGSVGTTALADNAVTEAKLNVSNSPTNGYVLSAQSGATGGLTWAADAAGTITAFTNGVDNRVVTATSATALNGETNFIYNGTIVGAGADGANADLGVGVHVKTADSGASADGGGDELIIENSGGAGISILTGNDQRGRVIFGDAQDNGVGMLEYNHDGNVMKLSTSGNTGLQIDGDGIVTKPKQPLFKVQQTGALTVADGHTVFSTNVTEAYDVNADFSGGAFTAPVSGYYHFSATVLYSGLSAGTDDTMEDRIVSSNQTETYSRFGFVDNAFVRQGYAQTKCSTILFMDANDTCYIQHFDGGTMAVYAQAPYSHFQGCLLQ